MRRIITVVVIFLIALFSFISTTFAAPQYEGDVPCYAALMIDTDSGTVLYTKNADEQIEPASTTKIMTCLLALENKSVDDKLTISKNAAGVSGSSLELEAGEEVKLGDLLTGMMMSSGNDAATAVAEYVGGDVATFVDMMNTKAQALGMDHTHFTSPHGKHDEDHYSTASDMAKLMQSAMKNPTFAEIINRGSFTMPQTNKRREKTYKNTNFLMREDKESYYAYATGGKTGSTTEAGYCLVASASHDDMNLICLLFRDDSEEGVKRWPLAKSLFDFGFNNFVTVDLQDLLDKAEPVKAQVENYASTDENDGLLLFEGPQSPGTLVTIDKTLAEGILNGTDTIESVPEYTSTLQAPVLKGDILGTVTYKSASTGDEITKGNLIAARDVLQAGAEPNASGGTAVTVVQPVNIEDIQKSDSNIYYWLIIPGVLIALLVWRLLTVQRRKRKRFNRKRPHYSYRIR